MIKMLLVFCLVLGVIAIGTFVVSAEDLKPGDKAPEFSLAGSDGSTHSLSEYRGTTVVLAWFPKAFTGG
jgi:peroxiredoxin Q/BCP